jgi:hypothetical protein
MPKSLKSRQEKINIRKMKTSEPQLDTLHGGKIDIAQNSKGGNSSWGVKEGYEADSVRLAWYNGNGGFDPISSAELPLWGLKELMKTAVQRDMLEKADLAELAGLLTASIYRQL